MGAQIPYQSPMTNPNGTVSRAYQGYFQDLQKGLTGPAGPQGPAGTAGGAGPTGPTGATGATGTRGSLWYSGSGAPSTISGQANGDWYLNTSNGDVYELVTGTWTLEGNIGAGSNLDGGQANTSYGGADPISGGTA